MNSVQLDRIVRNILTKHNCSSFKYLGVFPVEDICEIILSYKNNVFFIVNILPKKVEIGHWIVMCLVKNTIYIFDSFNIKLATYGLDLKSIKKKIVYCNFRLQSMYSLVCGCYCVWFVKKMLIYGIRHTMNLIYSSFSGTQFLNNDKKITHFVYLHFSKYLPPCQYLLCLNANISSYNTCNYLCSHAIKRL